jgi:cytochrome c-type biogenesis protein CcmF
MDLPKNVFAKQGHQDSASHVDAPINLSFVKDFTEKNLTYLKPSLINNRTIFQLHFMDKEDTTRQFTLYPESEVNQEMNSILSHPSRKIFWNRDIYVYVSSIPNPEETERKPQYFNLTLAPGEQKNAGNFRIKLENIVNLTEQAQKDGMILAAGATLNVRLQDSTGVLVDSAKSYVAQPIYTIGQDQKPGMVEADIASLGLKFAFVGIDPQNKTISLQVEYTPQANDWIVIKAIEKPYINLLWLGTFILSAGFGVSIYRRRREAKAKKA